MRESAKLQVLLEGYFSKPWPLSLSQKDHPLKDDEYHQFGYP